MNGFVLFALMMVVSPLNGMGTYSKTISDDDQIPESTLEIIENFENIFSTTLKTFIGMQNVLDSQDSPKMSIILPHMLKIFRQNIPVQNPVGESVADRLKWVKELVIPEAFGDKEKSDRLLNLLLNLKYHATILVAEFQIRNSVNNQNDLNDARDLASECTKAVEKLMG
eukprot:435476_1